MAILTMATLTISLLWLRLTTVVILTLRLREALRVLVEAKLAAPGQWSAVSGQWSVVSGQWSVVRGRGRGWD